VGSGPAASRRGVSKRSRFLANLAISAAAFVLLLLATEILLRTTHLFNARISWSQPDDIIGWRFTPNRTYWYNTENDHSISGRINSFGWRDFERPAHKPDDAFRIAVLGDSFAEAFQVELDSTFHTITERRMVGELGTNIELMNFGRMGMTQTEQRLVLEHEAIRFSPDMVILLFVPLNDIADVYRETASTVLRPFYNVTDGDGLTLDTGFNQTREYTLKKLVNPLKQHSALVSLLLERYNALRITRRASRLSPRTEGPAKISGYLSLCTEHPSETYLRNYRLNKRLIKSMADFCRGRDIDFMLVCLESVYEPEDARKYVAVDPTFNPDFFDEDMRRFADSLGIEYLGLQGKFKEYQSRTGRSLRWIHWNYDGHRVVADALCEKLKDTL
jgi:hypothetical protein